MFTDIAGKPKTTRLWYSTYARGAIHLQRDEHNKYIYHPTVNYYLEKDFNPVYDVYVEFKLKEPINSGFILSIPHMKYPVIIGQGEHKLSNKCKLLKYWDDYDRDFVVSKAQWPYHLRYSIDTDFDLWLTFEPKN